MGLNGSAEVPAGAREGHDPPGRLQICLAAPSKGTRPPNLSLRGAQRRGNPFPHNAQHCTGREAGHAPGPVLRPWRGAQALRLAGERIATPACALVRNDRLGGAVGLIESARIPAGAREGHDPPLQTHHQACPLAFVTLGKTPALHCAFRFALPYIGGAVPVKYHNL